jgi:hypothetical protein
MLFLSVQQWCRRAGTIIFSMSSRDDYFFDCRGLAATIIFSIAAVLRSEPSLKEFFFHAEVQTS